MNTKGFRRSHGAKPRSTSSTFISLHFNKADEDQLEISYKDDKETEETLTKSTSEIAQSNFTLYLPETKKNADTPSESISKVTSDSKVATSDSVAKGHLTQLHKKFDFGSREKLSEESVKSKFDKTLEGLKTSESSRVEILKNSTLNSKVEESEVDSRGHSSADCTDNELKLSPAIEAAELDDNGDNYIDEELKKAKCEILNTKKEMSSLFMSASHSEKDLRKESHSPFDAHLKSKYLESHQGSSDRAREEKRSADEETYFYNILNRIIHFINFARNNVKFHILIALLACLCAPIPSWLSGFFIGTILSSSVVYWLYKPAKSRRSFPNFTFIHAKTSEAERLQGDSRILKGWMNELPSFMNYHPDRYHISCTRSVYVRLDGSYLRFSFPQRNIPKRAMFNEPRHEMQFIHQQHYDIADAIIELLPKGLPNKRLWSKKYPICLRILNSKEAVLFNTSRPDGSDGLFSAGKTNKKENPNKKFSPRINEGNEIVIYLFSRTDRDKSLWFYRFQKASRMKVVRSHSPTLSTRIVDSDSALEGKRAVSMDFAFLQSGSSVEMEQPFHRGDGEEVSDDSFVEVSSLTKQQMFEMYMSSLLTPLHAEHSLSLIKKDKKDKKGSKAQSSQSNLIWLNVLIGRVFFDFLIEEIWAQMVTEKIQRKLNKIKLPSILSELIVKDINLGSALPKIHYASDPSIDERGLWIDIDISYNGSFHMTLETKLSLRRFKEDSEEFCNSQENLLSEVQKQTESSDQPMKFSMYNSDEDSIESSSDDETFSPEVYEDGSLKDSSLPPSSGSRSNKFLKFMDRLAQSPYLQHAVKNKFVKKAMDDLTNTPLVLTVEVQWLTGTLAVNIPPWPTDRLWYSFRTNPSLSITARPKLGQHVVTFTQVTEWIEKKLVSEFQKVLVMPNMDDLIIPIMQPCNDIPEA